MAQKAYQSQATTYNVDQTIGVSDKPGAISTVTVQAIGGAGNVDRCFGASVPADGDAGYAVGCYFHVSTGVAGATVYVNEGSATSCSFRALTTASGEVATFVYNSDSTSGALSPIPAAKMVNAMLDRIAGASDATDVTDTATALLALIPGAVAGSTFEFVYRNRSTTAGQKLTLTGGIGVTINSGASVYANGDITYIAIVTNVATPAITLYAEALAGSLQASVDASSSVNTLQLTTSATGISVAEATVGSDTNIGFILDGKGSGQIAIGGISTGQNSIGRGSLKPTFFSATISALGTTQNSTPTAAQLLGGIVTQTGATGAGTFTLPSGSTLSAAISPTPTVGDTFQCIFTNLGGGQTITITGVTGTTVKGKAAVATATSGTMTFINTGTNTWDIYCQ